MSNLTIRILVALVGIPLLVAASFVGGLVFLLLVSVASALALLEFYKLAELKGARPLTALGVVGGLAVVGTFYHTRLQKIVLEAFETLGVAIPFPTQSQLLFIILVLLIVGAMLVELFRKNGSPLLNLSTTLFGVLYVSLLFGTLIGIREVFGPMTFPMLRYFPDEAAFFDPQRIDFVYRWGGYTVISIFACIWLCDTAAYFVGRSMGKRKLFERVSPNKTWEGAIAGLLAAIATAVVAREMVLEYMNVKDAIVVGCIVGIFGQLGDLAESWMKRDAGVKDSSALIPGHGGVLDRFDSLLFVSPVAYLYIDFIIFS